MRPFKITIEQALYITAVILAVGLRLIALGSSPLSDSEANLALRAVDLINRQPSDLGGQPAYALFTGILFFVFSPENTLARLIPALVGGLLAGLPYFYRHELGRKTGLVLAFGLALDPGLLALSRQATGAVLGITFLVLAVTAWLSRKPVLAGALGALSIMAGASGLVGALGLGLAILVGRILDLSIPISQKSASEADDERWSPTQIGLMSGGGTILLVGTVFLIYPSGLGAIGSAIPALIRDLFTFTGISMIQQGFSLLAYQPIIVIFGVAGGILVWVKKDDFGKFLTIWFGIALLLAVLPPGREIWHLAWPLIPLMILAARIVADQLRWDSDSWYISAGLAILLVVLLSFIWLQLSAVARQEQVSQTRTLLLVGVFIIGGISTSLIALGWTWPVARRGLVWGLVVGLGIYSLSVSAHMVVPTSPKGQELWYSQPSVIDKDLLVNTLEDISEWSTGRRQSLDVHVTQDRPSLRWALRNYPEARFGAQPEPASMPSTLVTSLFEEPAQPAAYRGADFLWNSGYAWEGGLPPDLLRWIVFRESPTRSEHVIFWARNDLFPGGAEDPDGLLPIVPSSGP